MVPYRDGVWRKWGTESMPVTKLFIGYCSQRCESRYVFVGSQADARPPRGLHSGAAGSSLLVEAPELDAAALVAAIPVRLVAAGGRAEGLLVGVVEIVEVNAAHARGEGGSPGGAATQERAMGNRC